MDETQFAQAIAGTAEERDVSARAVANGYVMQGVRRFLDPVTRAVKLQQNMEAVAADATEAATMLGRFLSAGGF